MSATEDPWDTTPAERSTLDALYDWFKAHPDPDAGSSRRSRDRRSVVVYWHGPPPTGLLELADQQLVPVTFESTRYRLDELMPVARQLVTDHHDVICSAGPSKDFSGIGVMLWSDPATNQEELVAALSQEVGVPVQLERYVDRGPTPWTSRPSA